MHNSLHVLLFPSMHENIIIKVSWKKGCCCCCCLLHYAIYMCVYYMQNFVIYVKLLMTLTTATATTLHIPRKYGDWTKK